MTLYDSFFNMRAQFYEESKKKAKKEELKKQKEPRCPWCGQKLEVIYKRCKNCGFYPIVF